ncbi:hypothetical protein FRB93_012332 [Tulasnella sp. JGI-2019a]|nr:hypothetical protein FRB93_012332 [Tulasnella sp. JGI-2019a]
MSKPTFFQSVFHRPSRKYATSGAQHAQAVAVTSDKFAPPNSTSTYENSRLSLSEQQVLDAAYNLLAKQSQYGAEGHVLPTLESSGRLSINFSDITGGPSLSSTPHVAFDLTTSQPTSSPSTTTTSSGPRSPPQQSDSAVGRSSKVRRRSTHTTRDMSQSKSTPSAASSSASHDGQHVMAGLALRHPASRDASLPLASHEASTSNGPIRQRKKQEQPEDSDNGEDDIFYTPRTSPNNSPSNSPPSTSTPGQGILSGVAASSDSTISTATTTAIVTAAATKLLQNPHRIIRSSASSTTSSTPEEAQSDYGLNDSSYAPSESTAPTSTVTSKSPSEQQRPRSTVSSSTSRSTKRRSAPAPAVPSSSSSVDSEWAKGVRWLSKPDKKVKPPPRSWTHEATGRTVTSLSAASTSSILEEEAEAEAVAPRRRSLDSPSDYLRDLQVPQRPPRSANRPKSIASVSSSSSSSVPMARPRRHPQPNVAASGSDTRLLRMSAVLEVEEEGNGIVIGTAHPSVLHRHVVPERGSVRRRSSLRTRTSSDPLSFDPTMMAPRRAASLKSRSSSTSTTYKTVELATTLAVTDGGEPSSSNGYTSLVLPRAAYTPGKNPISSKVDLTRGGLAQTTMSTISVIRHGAAVASSKKRRSILGVGGLLSRSSSSAAVSATRKGKSAAESALALTSNTPPPSKVQSNQVLVRVSAVAVDGLDHLIVNEKCSKPDGYGFVPGRSFVGRVVEAGWEVTTVQKGDWVVGLMEFNRSGALSEFLVVDRKRVCAVPDPSPKLTLEQMALLPLVGLPSSRAARSMPGVKSATDATAEDGRERNLTVREDGLVKGRALVLGAQSVVGTMVVRQLKVMGVTVTAHILPSRSRVAWDRLVEEGSDGKDYDDVEVIEDGDVERAIGRLPDSAFKLVVDTIGGKGTWKIARRVLDADGGQFTTTVGDTPEVIPTRNAHVKSNMRSLRHAFSRKDDKAVGYIWVCPAVDVDHDGEDVRDTLKAVMNLTMQGICVPHVERTVPFERTPTEVFGGEADDEDGLDARPVVIRVIG